MHIHATQANAYAQLDALRSAQRAAARREAARVRKELLESASELAGESDSSDLIVMPTEERRDSQRRSKPQNEKNGRIRQKPAESSPTDSEDPASHISDWA